MQDVYHQPSSTVNPRQLSWNMGLRMVCARTPYALPDRSPFKGSLKLKGALQGILITSGYEVKNVSTFWLLLFSLPTNATGDCEPLGV